jgi:hypothetical protein
VGFLPGADVFKKVLAIGGEGLKKAWHWLMTPIPFALGPLLILCFFSLRSCQKNRNCELRNVQISDTLAMALADVRRLREDTAVYRKQERAYQLKFDSTSKAHENYRLWLATLSDAALQREVDRVFNRPADRHR